MNGRYHSKVACDIYTHPSERAPLPKVKWSDIVDETLESYVLGLLPVGGQSWMAVDYVSL